MSKSIYITEGQKKRIIESAGDLEYHFTTLDSICGMMETDCINLGETSKYMELNRFGKNYFSLSRQRSSADGYGNTFADGDSMFARIEFDGRKLNSIRSVDVRPYDYFYNNVEINALERKQEIDGRESEYEDSLTLKNGENQIKDAIGYIIRIDIFLPEHCDDLKIWDIFLKNLNMYPDWAEKMRYFTTINDFNYQKNELPKNEIYRKYSAQYKQALEENKQKMGKKIYITENQLETILENNNLLNEHVAVIDNTADAEKLIGMQWTSPDDIWFIQVTQRKKDFRSFNTRHQGKLKWWKRVSGIDGTCRENFVGYGIVQGNTKQEAIDSLKKITIHLNPWAANIIGKTDVSSNGKMEAIYTLCDKLWARAYITINKRSMSRTQRLAAKRPNNPRAFEMELSRNHNDAQYYPWSMIDMDIDHPNAWSETDAALKKLNINPSIAHKSHDGMHYFFNNRDIMKYTEHSPEFNPIARKYAGSKQPGEAFTMKNDAKMIIYSPCGK